MDINKIQQQLIQSLEQKNTDSLAHLAKLLHITAGKSIEVTVKSSEIMSSQDQTALQKQTATALSQVREQIGKVLKNVHEEKPVAQISDEQLIEDTRIPPKLRALLSQLVQQQNLLKAPQLRWLEVTQNGKAVHLYTDQKIETGSAIKIQMNNSQALKLIEIPGKNNVNITTPAVSVENIEDVSTTKAPNTLNNPLKELLIKNPDSILQETLDNQLLNKNVLNKYALDKVAFSKESINKVLFENSENTEDLINIKNSIASPSASKAALAQYQTQLQTKNLSGVASVQSGKTSGAIELLTNKLRELITANQSQPAIFNLIHQIYSQSPELFKNENNKTLEQALRSMAEKIRSPEQLSKPETIRQLVRTNGLFYESQLKSLVKNNVDDFDKSTTGDKKELGNLSQIIGKVQQLSLNDSKGALSRIIRETKNNLPTESVSNKNNSVNKNLSVSESDDFTDYVSNLIKQVLTQLGTYGTSDSNQASDSLKNRLSDLLAQLKQPLGSGEQSGEQQKKIMQEIVSLLQQQAVHGLARIQLHQIHSLLQQFDSADKTAGTQTWQIDVPVRHQQEVHPFSLQIEKNWVNPDSKSTPQNANNKIREWNITLTFDLPNMGEFCAQMNIVGDRLNAKLWAERETTLAKVKRELEKLKQQMEKDGIQVQSLQCQGGLPAQKKMKLSYSLIDIST